jgi:hypothetical protein
MTGVTPINLLTSNAVLPDLGRRDVNRFERRFARCNLGWSKAVEGLARSLPPIQAVRYDASRA